MIFALLNSGSRNEFLQLNKAKITIWKYWYSKYIRFEVERIELHASIYGKFYLKRCFRNKKGAKRDREREEVILAKSFE